MIRLINILVTFFAGIIGFGLLFLILVLITIKINSIENNFFILALPVIFSPLYEELGRYFSILIWKIKVSYSFFFGFGWGVLEAIVRYINKGISVSVYPILIHIIAAIILCYFINKKKPVLGLLTAIAIHSGYNYLLYFLLGIK
ncbi:hypothetical protein KKF47_03540 [Patescibacteria group bacterium]|nr:hypothetical protein [Patescibacteria group bacterium]MBU4467101.1 hypothetical protein [Patescibacteria group bacterium]MCG2699779.1 hypothetical protein [Candidatus Parcubacteria bacterium]